jgi:hypothetical protein
MGRTMTPSSRTFGRASLFAAGSGLAALVTAAQARAQTAPTGAPPPDATALVAAPTAAHAAPDLKKPQDGTNVSISAGGQLETGNTQLLAATVNGQFDSRRGANGFGASLLGNYGQGATPGNATVETAENLQGRVRYDRYIIDQASLFLINTGRHDKFQGLEFRYNLDPGVKYLFLSASDNALWVEAGYDFQYDVREDGARVQLDATGAPDPTLPLLSKTEVNHSIRLFVGFKHAFNPEVTLASGLEYIQSVSDGKHRWVNFDALLAAKVWGGLAVGLGFSARYDDEPLPTKKEWDTTTTASLIYAFSDATPPKPPVPTCAPAPAVVPEPAPASAPPATTPPPVVTTLPPDAPVTTGTAPTTPPAPTPPAP